MPFKINWDIYADERARAKQQALEKVKGLIGTPETQASKMLEQGIPVEQYTETNFPMDVKGPSGLLGMAKTPEEQEAIKFYGGLLTTPGYETAGAQGILGLQTNKQAALTAAAKSIADKEQSLRSEYQKNLGEFAAAQGAYQQARAALEGGSGFDTVAAVMKFSKTLDPRGIVTDKETGQIIGAAGFGEELIAAMNKALSGQGMSVTARQKMADTLHRLYQARAEKAKMQFSQYKDLSIAGGVSPERVMTGLGITRDEIKPMSLLNQAPPQITELPPGAVKR